MADLPRYNLVSDEAPPQLRMLRDQRVPPLPGSSEEKHFSMSEERVDSGVGYSLESQDFSALSLEGVRDFLQSDACTKFRKQGEKYSSPTSDNFTSGLQSQLRNLSIRDGTQTKESLKSNRCDSGICDSGNFSNFSSVEEPFIQAALSECHLLSAVSFENPFSLQELQELSSQDEDGDTPLHMSIIMLLPDVALKILSLAHANSPSPPDQPPSVVNLPNALRQTPLHLAVATRQFYLARSLMVAGASLEAPDFCGNTALHLACRDGLPEIALCLLSPVQCPQRLPHVLPFQHNRVPQDLSIKNYDGYTCAHLALMGGHLDILALLLQKGADVNEADGKSGRTLLHLAADQGDLGALQVLLTCPRLHLNALTYSGLTPVALAHGRGSQPFVDALCARGADPSQLSLQQLDTAESTDEEMNDGVYDDICINGEPVQF